MIQPLNLSTLRTVYDRIARRYDAVHALITFGGDGRGRRWVAEHTIQIGDRVLDAGAGTGASAALAAKLAGPAAEIVLFDLSAGMLAIARKRFSRETTSNRFHFETGDIHHLPFPDNAFDAVISTYSLCPLGDPTKGILELLRVTRPGGRLGFAHSVEPSNRLLRGLGRGVESLAARFPTISMGCRPISVLPALEQKGCEILHRRTIGFPLWPFLACVVRKPAP